LFFFNFIFIKTFCHLCYEWHAGPRHQLCRLVRRSALQRHCQESNAAGRLQWTVTNWLLFYGTSGKNIDKLQRVPNTLARVVKERSMYDRITPLLSRITFLPNEARSRRKIAVFTFKAVSTRSKPSYLAELVLTHTPARELRSSSRRPNQPCMIQTSEPLSEAELFNTQLQQCGTVCRRRTDTALSLATFKSRLKTLLNNQSFRCWSSVKRQFIWKKPPDCRCRCSIAVSASRSYEGELCRTEDSP